MTLALCVLLRVWVAEGQRGEVSLLEFLPACDAKSGGRKRQKSKAKKDRARESAEEMSLIARH